MSRPLPLLLLACGLAALQGCQCHGDTLMTNDDPNHPQPDAGPPVVVKQTPPPDAGVTQPPAGWCASDCDCATGSTCVATTGELTGNSCAPGTNTCMVTCPVTCGAGTQCVQGVCTVTPCVGANCGTSSFPTSVAGNYETFYTFDIHDFAQQAFEIGNLINLLSAALSGQANCTSQTGAFNQLFCVIVSVAAQNIHAPPWVQQLLNVLSDLFKFGGSPVTAHGMMQLAEAPGGVLVASESWDQLWMDYNGQHLNVMNSPVLGANGNITVTVKAFGGTRDAYKVYLGPRDINFDVNKLLVNLLNVAISAASNNQAQNVGDLIDLILCNQIPISNSNYATCIAAAQVLAQQFELDSGLGGIHLDHQEGSTYDDNNDGVADHLGKSSNPGSVSGDISNGLIDGALGAYPASNWWGDRH